MAIVVSIGIAHAIVLLLLPGASSYPGRWVDVMISVSVVAAVVLTLVDRNDRLLAQLADEARADALTGLLNRRGFDERASLEVARARRQGDSIAIATFDIDHFKRVNDQWGHEIGDRVLAWTGRLLAVWSRDIDVVARFGGEEFVVLLPASDSADAASFAERVRTALATADSHQLPRIRVSAGVDSTIAPKSIDALLQGSDSALYDAKRAGRDRTMIFERPAHADSDRSHALAQTASEIRLSQRWSLG
jgi:diguanylate cyclase (GGDEF)-like protein